MVAARGLQDIIWAMRPLTEHLGYMLHGALNGNIQQNSYVHHRSSHMYYLVGHSPRTLTLVSQNIQDGC